jgi:MYXO-CTERM domain-containing protein
MNARGASVRLSLLVGVAWLLAAGRADAQTTCMTDKDCPGTACGGQVCFHSSGTFTCVDANTQGLSGASDGWCATSDGTAVDSNCKCAPQGATCLSFVCSFTVPTTGTGGSTGSGGATGAGGSTGSGGATGSAGTSGSAGGDSGCTVAGTPAYGSLMALGLFAAVAIGRRARRRA